MGTKTNELKMKKQNIRTLSLVVITLTYLIIGAAVFDYFESDNENRQQQRLNQNITAFKKKYGMNDTEFNRLWIKILEKKPYQAGNQWKFVGSLYFCTVVVTLIGYGHSTPRTVAGKCFCIFYTLIGIPIFLIMFQSVGERLNSLIVFFLTRFKKRLKLKNQEVGLFELISIEFFLTMTITLVASYVFMNKEEWTYFDAMYYCFITLTTIGFGDYVPLQQKNFLSDNFAYACFTILFILIGLTTLASSMNLLVLRLATINAEEAVQERLEAAEARRNAVHLEGDVIQPNTRLFNTTEKPEQVETISVCSCACLDYKIWHHQNHQQPQQHHANHQTAAAKNIRHQQQRRSVVNSKYESSMGMSDGGGSRRRGSGARWRQTFLAPTLKRLLPAPLNRRLNNSSNIESKHSQYGLTSNPASITDYHGANEFEMMMSKQPGDHTGGGGSFPVPASNSVVLNPPTTTNTVEQPPTTTVNNPDANIAETNLLNLDAIDLCSSSSPPNVKRNSI